jgi:cell pole-organizing protein PopZ
MSQPAKAQEPSMEEILASIRRIIADDDSVKPAAPDPQPQPAAPSPPPVMAAPRPAPPPLTRVQPPAAAKQDDIDTVLAEIEPEPPKPVPPKPVPPKPAAAAAPPAPEVLDLTEAMAATTFRKIDGASHVVFAERGPDAPEPPRPAPAPSPASAMENGLISGATRAAVDSAFNSLANTVLGNNARTLEDLVKEMLRPMLKGWLDDNLPNLVERIVRAEIERVSRGR